MEASQLLHLMVAVFACLLVAAVYCKEGDQGADSHLEDLSQPQKRSVGSLPAEALPYLQDGDDVSDAMLDGKRSSLFRFGKRGSLFRFGKRGSLFRFGKRGSLFRFGKRGSLFRFGKRDGGSPVDELEAYPEVYLSDDNDDMAVKRAVRQFHWGRETEE